MHVNLLRNNYGPAAELVSDFSQSSPVLPKGERENPWVVLRVGGSTGSLDKTDVARDCGVSWRYQAWLLKNSFLGISRMKFVCEFECSFAVDANIRRNYCFGSTSHR